MSGNFVVGYDGSVAARRALEFAVERVRAQGGTIVLAHVLEWSPYSFLTPAELEERHKRRREEMERARDAITSTVVAELKDAGIEVETEIRYGKTADILSRVAKEKDAVQIIIGRDGQSALGARVFGSVAGALVQTAPVPCTIVP
ncbi:universal stress protein [Roseovarius tibetensis]|uniref:universal stress protein n=1 Tax=Roseovarius tibetensis TaxID=2685897 RepID=UPI003D7FFBB5